MDVHQSAQFINLDGDEGPFFEILKSRFFQLDGERLHALRRPELYLRLGLIAERQLSGDEPVLRGWSPFLCTSMTTLSEFIQTVSSSPILTWVNPDRSLALTLSVMFAKGVLRLIAVGVTTPVA